MGSLGLPEILIICGVAALVAAPIVVLVVVPLLRSTRKHGPAATPLRTCGQCGRQLAELAHFCSFCGGAQK